MESLRNLKKTDFLQQETLTNAPKWKKNSKLSNFVGKIKGLCYEI